MATYTDITINQDTGIGSGKIDGILFSSVNLAEGSFPVSQPKVAPVNSIFDPSGNQTNKALIINAVDIDWNGAKLGIGEDNSTGITTTGELLKLIKKYADTKKSEAIDYVQGTDDDDLTDGTIWGARKYADDAATTAKNEAISEAKQYTDGELAKLQNRVDALESALSTLAQNVGALVTIANG